MNPKFFLVLSIPLLHSGCYLPTTTRINSRLNVDKMASFIANKTCKNKTKRLFDKESFDKALLIFSREKIANRRINRITLVKKAWQALEKCGVNLKNIILESNQMNSLTHPIKKIEGTIWAKLSLYGPDSSTGKHSILYKH